MVTGKPGVCVVTAGPGFTNMITGTANAAIASSPIICISGHSPLNEFDTGSLQDMNQIDVIKVTDYQGRNLEYIDRELALIKVSVDEHRRSEVLSIIDIFRGKVVDVSRNHYTVEITGEEDKIAAIIELFRPLGIREIVRSGKVTLQREARIK